MAIQYSNSRNAKLSLCLVFIFFLIAEGGLTAQNKHKIDSLSGLFLKSNADTIKVMALNAIAKEYWASDPDTSLLLLDKAYLMAEKLSEKKFLTGTLLYKAYTLAALNNYDSSVNTYKLTVDLSRKFHHAKNEGMALSGLGNVYNVLGDYEKAIKFYSQALKVQEANNEKAGLSRTYNSLGVLFEWQGDYKKALDYHLKALKIKEELGDKNTIAMSFNNIGIVYSSMKEFAKSLEWHLKALDMRIKNNDISGMAMSYSNLGNVYDDLNKIKEAINAHQKSIELYEQMGDDLGRAKALYNLGSAFMKSGQRKKGGQYIMMAEKITDPLEVKELQKDIYNSLYMYYSTEGNYQKAFDYSLKYMTVKDSMYNENKVKEINEINTRYETAKKEKEIALLNHKNEIQELDIKHKQTFLYSTIGGIVLLILLAFVLYNRNVIKQKANEQLAEQKKEIEIRNVMLGQQKEEILTQNESLEQQKEEILAQRDELEHQKNLVEEKNREITDSIHYAKRIQRALLTSESLFKKYLPEYFIFYKPKDIVSGDFYWFSPSPENEKSILLTAADCTGHGVPGAFMSMLGISNLNDIVLEKRITSPEIILNELRKNIITALNPEFNEDDVMNQEMKDGMDMSLCYLNMEKRELKLSAANNPVWIIRNGKKECEEIAPDKFPVGVQPGKAMENFTLKSIQLEKGDTVYLFTDGYADQFGGPDKQRGGRKFKYKKMQELLLTVSQNSMRRQKIMIDEAMQQWMKDYEQVDDMLIIGIRV